MGARIEEVDGRRGSDNRPEGPPLLRSPHPEPSKPTRSWLGSHRSPMRDKAPTSENLPASGGVPKTSSGSANRPSYQAEACEGKKTAATMNRQTKVEKELLEPQSQNSPSDVRESPRTKIPSEA